ncbi:NAD(P)H-binding protein [Nocardia sp. NPDC057663]|uniref:NAD(P)H-binding protein n=1 Tax=Nocardia sp. NPDC057663 TaxID=3346201 RepID=UPI0036709605
MTSLLVLGGSGRTGIRVLQQAAARGHCVRALVRNPDAVQAPPGVELIQGTPANIDDIREAARGADAVTACSTMPAPPTTPGPNRSAHPTS